MAEYYIAPSYRGYSILHDDIFEGKKRYAIIDFKGKEKKIRLWDKPQAGWKEDTAETKPNLSKPHYEEIDGCLRAVGLEKSLAELIGFGKKETIKVVALKEAGARTALYKRVKEKGIEPFRQSQMIGVYLPEDVDMPSDVDVPTFEVKKSDLLIDDNTWRKREDIWNVLWERRGVLTTYATYKWKFVDKKKLNEWKEKKNV